MTSIVEQLFESLDPWPGFHITAFEIRKSPIDGKKTLLLRLEATKEQMPICSYCHHEAPLIHEYTTRRVTECTILGYFVDLEIIVRRVECEHCHKKCMEYIDWIPRYQRHTERLHKHIEHRTEEETVAYAAQETNLSWDTVKKIDKDKLERRFGEFKWDGSHRLAVDEFAIHRHHKYATVVFSLDTKRVLWVGPGRSRKTLASFFALLTEEQKADIKAVAMDQSTAFDLEVKKQCPHAVVVYDLFHVLSNYGRKVIDRVRVDAANKLKHIPDLRKVVKGSRYLLYKRPEELSEHEHTKLADLAKLNSPLLKCYLMGDELRHLWGLGTRPQAIALVLDWIYRAAHSRIKPLVAFAQNLRNYIDGIVASCQYEINTSVLEGVNNRIKQIKRRAYGFHDDYYFYLKVKAAFPGLPR